MVAAAGQPLPEEIEAVELEIDRIEADLLNKSAIRKAMPGELQLVEKKINGCNPAVPGPLTKVQRSTCHLRRQAVRRLSLRAGPVLSHWNGPCQARLYYWRADARVGGHHDSGGVRTPGRDRQ